MHFPPLSDFCLLNLFCVLSTDGLEECIAEIEGDQSTEVERATSSDLMDASLHVGSQDATLDVQDFDEEEEGDDSLSTLPNDVYTGEAKTLFGRSDTGYHLVSESGVLQRKTKLSMVTALQVNPFYVYIFLLKYDYLLHSCVDI